MFTKEDRLWRWDELAEHPIYQAAYSRLNKAEKTMCVQFLYDHMTLTPSEFAVVLNRWLLDKPKPKKYNTMWALLCAVNPTIVRRRRLK